MISRWPVAHALVDSFQRNKLEEKIALVVLFLISAEPGFAFQSSGEWITYKSAAGRYSVLLPVQPTLSTHESFTAAGKKVTQYRATASDGKATFLIGYYDYFSGTTFSFDKARDGIVGKIKGTLLSERAIRLGGHRGRELKVSAIGPDGTEFGHCTEAAATSMLVIDSRESLNSSRRATGW